MKLTSFYMYKNKKIILIAALQADRGIGANNTLLYHIRDDMKHFKDQTMGHSILSGRKNCEDIDDRYWPLKGRDCTILTHQKSYDGRGARVVHHLLDAFEQATHDTIYVIGGGEIYSLALPYADLLDLTIISANKPADIFFPEFKHLFELKLKGEILFDEKTTLDYRHTLWVPKK